jgi:hypothetical protein
MRKPFGKSLSVQGTNNVPIPPEIRDYYRGKGIPLAFLKKHYGLGKTLLIQPTPEQLRAKMLGGR